MTSRYRTLVGFIVALLGATALILVTPNPAPAQPPCKALCYLEHADRIADCRLDPADKRQQCRERVFSDLDFCLAVCNFTPG